MWLVAALGPEQLDQRDALERATSDVTQCMRLLLEVFDEGHGGSAARRKSREERMSYLVTTCTSTSRSSAWRSYGRRGRG